MAATIRGSALTHSLLGLALALHLSTCQSGALTNTLFNEDFNGYTYFPNEIPVNDPVNKGIPKISEGADEFWYGVRFQTGDGTINSDLAVQRWGDGQHGANNTPVGRFEDDAGIVLRIDTTGYENIHLSFIWRTFSADSGDKFTVGYHIGDDLGFDTGSNRYRDLKTGPGAWTSSWTQLMSGNARNSFKSENFALPDDAGPVYVAFWLNDGEGDYGKLDNVVICGTVIPPVPEPTTATLVILGGAGWLMMCCRRRD